MAKAGLHQIGPSEPLTPSTAASGLALVQGLGAWLEQTCQRLVGTTAAIIVIGGDAPDSFELATAWPSQPAALHLVPLSERCLGTADVVVHEEAGVVSVATPQIVPGARSCALVLQVRSTTLSAAEIIAAAATASRFLSQLVLGNFADLQAPQREQLKQHKQLLELVCQPQVFVQSALETVNWVATQFACIRVGLGLVQKNGVRLQALSHSAWFDRRSQAVTAIENAMDEALEQRHSVVLPALAQGRAMIAIAHRDAAQGQAVCSVVLAGGGGLGAGVLYLERSAAEPFTAAEVRSLEQIGQLIGPVLEAKQAAYGWLGGRPRLAWQAFVEHLRDPRRPALRAGLVLAALALAALTLVDTAWRVSADAAIEGEQQRVIPAPFEGFIASASVKAGLVVRQGEPLAELDTRQIRLDFQRWAAEVAQHESRYRDALARHDRPAAAMAMAQMQQAQAQRALAEDKLARARLTAPFDAFVVSGDLSQHIGSPVEQGKVLFELAPLDSYRVVLKVDERDIRSVRVGQSGSLMLAGLTEERLALHVKNISVPEASDGRNVFRVEAQLDQANVRLRPGMQGVAKIEAGERSLLWIWTHSAWQWLQLQAWKWSP